MKQPYIKFADFLNSNKKISILTKAIICLLLLSGAIVLYFKVSNKTFTFIEIIVNLLIVVVVLIVYQLIYSIFLKNMELNILNGQIGLALKTHLKPTILKEVNDEPDIIGFVNSASEIEFPETSAIEDIEMIFINFNESFLNEKTENNIINRLDRLNIKLKILIINPFSIYVTLRGKDLERNDAYITENHANHIKLLEFKKKLIAKGICEEKIEIKYYDAIPTILYVRCGQFAWFAPVWNHASARKNSFVKIDMLPKSKISENLNDNFAKLWENGKSCASIKIDDTVTFDEVMKDASLYLNVYKKMHDTII